jgi:BirA family biotin operon repressor/biotin-[acetyl-CoA-carboxylase] ligase
MALGVAAVDACAEAAGVEARLKWPNDLVVPADGGVRKLGGMLSESVIESGRLEAVVLGIGINVNWPDDLPADLSETATALNHVASREIARDQLLAAMLVRFDALYGALGSAGAGDDDGGLAEEYRARSATLGTEVSVATATETVVGRAVDIGDDGSLVLELRDGGRRIITTGDVTQLRPA